VKRALLVLTVFVIVCFAIFGLETFPISTSAQQTPTDEVSIQPLPVPTNVIGTFIRGVSNDGKRIVFDSINDYNGNNKDSNTEIWVYDVDSRTIIQVTDTKDITDPADATKVLTKINNVTPVISGDGTKIAFVSNASLGDTTNDNNNYEIYLANLPLGATQATISRITSTGKNSDTEVIKEIFTNYDPAINDDGTLIGFVSTRGVFNQIPNGAASFTALKEGPSNSDPDGNAEVFLYNVTQRQYSQVTVSRDVDATVNFVVKGFNSRPVLSGNGQVMVFLSGFNYPSANANKNSDFNGEIFLYRVGDPNNTFRQVTETNGNPGANTDLPALPANGVVNVLAASTHPLSSDGTKLVFESSGNLAGKNADSANLRTRELYLADLSGATTVFTQLTDQPAVDINNLGRTDFNFIPSINSTGTFITFVTVLNLTPASPSSVTTDNGDGSKEVFRYDIAAAKFRQLTFTPASGIFLDQRGNTYSSFINPAGNLATFSVIAQLLQPNAALISDLFQASVRPVTSKNAQEAKIANAASYDATQVGRGSIVAAFGTQLANSTQTTPSANLPFELNGVTVTVGGVAAQLIFVSAGQVNFVIPQFVGEGDAVDFTINNNGVQSAGKVKIIAAAPGIFSATGDGKGPAAAQCGAVAPDGMSFPLTVPPCSVGNESLFSTLVIYGTGWRNASSLQVKIGDQTLTPAFAGAQPNFQGLDQMNVTLTKELAGKSDLDLSIVVPLTTPIESNKTKISFLPFQESFTVANGASFEVGSVAPGSSAIGQGMNLANSTASGPPGLEIAGVRVNVAGIPATLTSVSPTAVNFVVPQEVKPFNLIEVVVNNNGTILRSRVTVLKTSPGLFTTTNDGNGRVRAQCGRPNPDGSITFTDPPCAVGTEANPNILRVFGTGWRNSDKVVLKVADVDLTPTFSGPQPNVFGIDLIDVKLVPSLAGRTDVDVMVTATEGTTNRTSKAGIKISFTQ
jgi:uncharacterized protein (TIGR03437 family)